MRRANLAGELYQITHLLAFKWKRRHALAVSYHWPELAVKYCLEMRRKLASKTQTVINERYHNHLPEMNELTSELNAAVTNAEKKVGA